MFFLCNAPDIDRKRPPSLMHKTCLTYTLRGYIIKKDGDASVRERMIRMEMDMCCRTDKTKCRAEEEKRALINRLSRIEGQIRGLRGMVEKDAYCTDILTQAAAAAAALNAFNRELLASHIRTCVAEDIRAGKDEVIDELTATLQKLMK